MNYFLRRLVAIPPLVLLIATLGFFLVRLAPGGPFDSERAQASPEIERRLRERYHLDEPLPLQYLRFLKDLARGDLGVSRVHLHHTVSEMILAGLPVSMTLGLLSFVVAVGLGVPMGFLVAIRQARWVDGVGLLLVMAAICVPAFILGPMLILIFGMKLGWFPVGLWGSPLHAVLPTATLGLYFAGRVARLTREGTRSTLNSGFVRAARAKGLGELRIIFRHALPVAILPVLSYSGPLLADLLTGSFVVENIFQIPGIGVFLVNSTLNRDYTLVVALVMLYATILLFLNLVVDLAYGVLDPRVGQL